MSDRCFIFGALAVDRMPVEPTEDDFIIAADQGYDVALSLGVTPDLVIGDFDSRGEAPDVEDVIRLPIRKDDTDVQHAVELALERGYHDFILYGAVGGKLDHTMANIAIAEHIALSGGKSVFYGEDCSFTVIRDASIRFDARESGRISVFSLEELSSGITIKGLSYEAQNITLRRDTPTGVSNAFVGKEAAISVEDGTLLIIFDSE